MRCGLRGGAPLVPVAISQRGPAAVPCARHDAPKTREDTVPVPMPTTFTSLYSLLGTTHVQAARPVLYPRTSSALYY